jgi:hypothetical protein
MTDLTVNYTLVTLHAVMILKWGMKLPPTTFCVSLWFWTEVFYNPDCLGYRLSWLCVTIHLFLSTCWRGFEFSSETTSSHITDFCSSSIKQHSYTLLVLILTCYQLAGLAQEHGTISEHVVRNAFAATEEGFLCGGPIWLNHLWLPSGLAVLLVSYGEGHSTWPILVILAQLLVVWMNKKRLLLSS